VSNVLFVCVQNAGRSQIAASLLERAGGDRHAARSSGSAPAERIHPEVVAAMSEVGIDLAGRVPRALDRTQAEWADVIVTMGCGDACPSVPGKRYVDWQLPDPHGAGIEQVRAIRDEVGTRVAALVRELDAEAI
jgi:arsenate reductase